MAEPINPDAQWPGDNMNPDAIDTAAADIAGVGSSVTYTTGNVAKAWAGLSKGYHAPEQETLFGAMKPATKAADDFDTDLGKVCAALTTFAAEVRIIKANVAKLRADARTFRSEIHDGKVTVTQHLVENRAQLETGTSTTTTKDVDWQSDQPTVEANNGLIRKVNDQQEQLWAAERKCANAIRDIYGAKHISAASNSNPHGYGVDQIPDNAGNLPWGNTVDVKEDCGSKIAGGVIFDWGLNGFGGLAGFHYTPPSALGPEQVGFSRSTFDSTWKAAGDLAQGLRNPLTPALALLPGPVGKSYNASAEAVTGLVPSMLGIDVFGHQPDKSWITDWNPGALDSWKNDPWTTLGMVGANILTFAIPGPKGLGALSKAGDAAKAGEGTGEAANAARAAEEISDLSKITHQGSDLGRLADPAGKTELGNLGNTVGKLGDEVSGLGKTDLDLPNVPHAKVHTGSPNVGDHAGADAPRPRAESERGGPVSQHEGARRPALVSAGGGHETPANHVGAGDGGGHRTAQGGNGEVGGHHGGSGPSASNHAGPEHRSRIDPAPKAPSHEPQIAPRPKTDHVVNVSAKDGPGPRTPFAARTDLGANTVYHVEGRGDFYTNEHGRVIRVETTYRPDGRLNWDLHRPQPNTTYVVHPDVHHPAAGLDYTHSFVTDEHGRTVLAHADHLTFGDAHRSPGPQGKVGNLGGPDYNGGHLLAKEFGGGPEKINLVSMLEKLNKGPGNSYRAVEHQWGRIIREQHYVKDVTIKVKYHAPGTSIPDKFTASWQQDGVQYERSFYNS